MKNIHPFLLAVIALLMHLSLHAQTFESCGTPPPDPNSIPAPVSSRNDLDGPFNFQIFVHILRDDNGANPAISEPDLYASLQHMANFFQPHNICFTLTGLDYINNTIWNSSYNADQITSMHAINPHTDAIDVYVHSVGFTSGTELAAGSAYSIPSAKCSISATASTTTFAHEMGHCLGLSHTFSDVYGMECPSGENCENLGDRVCDTPADFTGSQLLFSPANACVYNGTQSIFCDGTTYTYNPPVDNLMSYWTSCRNKFTDGQRERIVNTINENDFLQDRLTPGIHTISGQTFSGNVDFGARDFIVIGSIPAPVVMNGNVHGLFNSGIMIQLLPGTYVTPSGSRSVEFRINQLCANLPDNLTDPGGNSREAETEAGTPADDAIMIAPNPFSGSTTITYHLNGEQEVDLRIFNSVGQMVAQPVRQEYQDAGTHAYQLHAENLAPGIYFLVLQTGNQKLTKRLVLAR